MEESGAQEKRYNVQDASVMTEESGSVGPDSHTYTPEQRPSTVKGAWKPYGCDKCGKRFTLKGSLKTHEKLHGFRPTYTCDVCGKNFKVASGLKAHEALHAGAKPFRCEICGKTFTLKGSLKTHSAIHSVDREGFPCYICGKMYKGKASLMTHIALHLGKRPDTCEVCDQSSNPTLHASLSCDQKPFVCQVCGVCFELRSHLIQHITLHLLMLSVVPLT